MKRPRSLLAIALTTMLPVIMLGAPSSAATTGALTIVNGRPGGKVDVCLNGREIRSGLPCGGRVSATFFPGDKVLKIRHASTGTCRGTLLATRLFPLLADDDISLVVNKVAPKFVKFVKFDNTDLGTIPPDGEPYTDGFFAWRHAADLGPVNVHYTQPIGPQPAALPVWKEGDQYVQGIHVPFTTGVVATRPEKQHVFAASPIVTFAASRRHEFYLLGTTTQNAKFIVFSRQVSQPPV
jgi:hypothetical protein